MSDIVFCPPNVECPCYARLVDEAKRLREANELMLTDIRRTDVDMLAFKARIEQLEAALRDVCGLEVYGFAITGPDGKDVVCEGTNRFVRETDFKAVRKTARAALGKERT